MKQGDFSKYVSDGFTGLTNPFTGSSYGTALPSVNASAQKLLSLYPDPNVGDPTAYTDNGVANYVVNKIRAHTPTSLIFVATSISARTKSSCFGASLPGRTTLPIQMSR
jgi:hypothetical protein